MAGVAHSAYIIKTAIMLIKTSLETQQKSKESQIMY